MKQPLLKILPNVVSGVITVIATIDYANLRNSIHNKNYKRAHSTAKSTK